MNSKEQLLLNIIQEGVTSISNLLLTNYKKIGLTDNEMMVIIHIIYYKSMGNDFPTIGELEKRMTLNAEDLMKILQRLVKNGYIYIEDYKNDETGVLFEIYNINPTYLKIISMLEREVEKESIDKLLDAEEKRDNNIYKIFETEFGRPLSPMEIELITTWTEKDKYLEEIIIYALKEAVFSNKLNFRYIDSILFEWQKKNIKSLDQVRQHVKNFRANKKYSSSNENSQQKYSFEFYNWLEENE